MFIIHKQSLLERFSPLCRKLHGPSFIPPFWPFLFHLCCHHYGLNYHSYLHCCRNHLSNSLYLVWSNPIHSSPWRQSNFTPDHVVPLLKTLQWIFPALKTEMNASKMVFKALHNSFHFCLCSFIYCSLLFTQWSNHSALCHFINSPCSFLPWDFEHVAVVWNALFSLLPLINSATFQILAQKSLSQRILLWPPASLTD